MDESASELNRCRRAAPYEDEFVTTSIGVNVQFDHTMKYVTGEVCLPKSPRNTRGKTGNFG